MNEVTEFINRRFKNDCQWMNGNCYWFAFILCSRFSYLQLAYLTKSGHFMAYDKLNELLYDFGGKFTRKDIDDNILLLSEIKDMDINWYNIIVRDCVN